MNTRAEALREAMIQSADRGIIMAVFSHPRGWTYAARGQTSFATQRDPNTRFVIGGLVLVREDQNHYASHEALVDLTQLWAEYEALNGGGPDWQKRFQAALAIANDLTRREP